MEAFRLVFSAVVPEVAVAVLRNLNASAPCGFEPTRESAYVGSVGPNRFQARQRAFAGTFDRGLCSAPAMRTGGVEVGEEHEPRRIGQDVALPAVRFAAS